MTIKQTALHSWHTSQNAKMVEFANYSMPVQYELGVLKEHLHTRAEAGLFDVSHMGQIIVTAEAGVDLAFELESVFPTDLVGLSANRQVYSLLLNETGGVIDDLMICRRQNDFMLVVNAGCKEKDLAFLVENLPASINLNLLSDRSLLALQGPKSEDVLVSLGADVEQMVFMDAGEVVIAGINCWVTRSGYTGEDGFEISVANSDVEELANALTHHDSVEAIGLGARDSLRLEAGLCLYGHELNSETTPIEAGLPWAISKNRRIGGVREGRFIGADVILDQMRVGVLRQRVALIAEGKAPVREGAILLNEQGDQVGEVVSGGFGPSIQKPIAMAYIDSELAVVGSTVKAKVRKKLLPLKIEKTPFLAHRYKR